MSASGAGRAVVRYIQSAVRAHIFRLSVAFAFQRINDDSDAGNQRKDAENEQSQYGGLVGGKGGCIGVPVVVFDV